MILIIHLLILLQTIRNSSPTVDEVSHLPAGLSHWRFGRFDLYRVNPPFVSLVASVPLLFCDFKEDWSQYSFQKNKRLEFSVGKRFVDLNGADSIRLYRYGRLACVPFSLIGAVSVYWLARNLYEPASGVVAMCLWCFSPNVLGNAAIITPDVAGGALAILAALAFWKWLDSPNWGRTVAAGLALGLAELAKTTCVILYVVWPVMWVVWRWRCGRTKQEENSRVGDTGNIGQLIVIFMLGVYVTNLGYLFDGSFQQLKDYQFVSHALGGPTASHAEPNNRFRDSMLGYIPVPFPVDYIHGIDLQKLDFEGGQMPLKQRVPKLKGFNNPFRVEYYAVNLDVIDALNEAEVSPAILVQRSASHKGMLVKVLGRGKITKAVKVSAHAVSKTAEQAIIAAGGTVTILPKPYKGVRPAAKGSQFTNR